MTRYRDEAIIVHHGVWAELRSRGEVRAAEGIWILLKALEQFLPGLI